jgi:hypothetical protein
MRAVAIRRKKDSTKWPAWGITAINVYSNMGESRQESVVRFKVLVSKQVLFMAENQVYSFHDAECSIRITRSDLPTEWFKALNPSR